MLDARNEDLRLAQPLPSAVPLSWSQLTYPDLPDKGRLLDDDQHLARILTETGREQLRDAIALDSAVALDTREDREYRGETPYGEARGGHVPGAKHLWYRDLIGTDGRVLADEALRQRLAPLGITADTEIIAYCTGGVRAAFVTTMLTQAGYHVRNYAGSMWHWAAGDASVFPLRSSHEATI